MVCNEKNTYHEGKILLRLVKSDLIFPHGYNITLSASPANFSFMYGTQGITDTNLLYKDSLKKNTQMGPINTPEFAV